MIKIIRIGDKTYSVIDIYIKNDRLDPEKIKISLNCDTFLEIENEWYFCMEAIDAVWTEISKEDKDKK